MLTLKREDFIAPFNEHPRIHSQRMDLKFGLNIESVEAEILKRFPINHQKKEFWVGLESEILLTPYSELLNYLLAFKDIPKRRIVDLGAGYGRLGLVAKTIHEDIEFLGYEAVPERTDEANRVFKLLQLDNCYIDQQNLLQEQFLPKEACLYFLYDFTEPTGIKIFLRKFIPFFHQQFSFLIVKGKGANSLIRYKFPELWRLHGVLEMGGACLYSSYLDLNENKERFLNRS